jgi:hypothetical protein
MRRLRQPGWLALFAVIIAIAALYGRALPRYFTSEDFLLLRFLRAHPPWRNLGELLLSPWLGISVVKFYRPVATLILAAEGALFGATALPYNAVHLLVHAVNAGLVWRIARRCGGTEQPAWTPLAIALLFALYPLHPNAVLFIASFATLFASTFLLLAIDAYQTGRRVSSLVAFALALGSYEAAVVLPGLLIAHDLVLPAPAAAPASQWRSAARRWTPYCVLLALYLVLRHQVLGVTLGGYQEAGERLLAPHLAAWARDFGHSVWWLHVPVFDAVPRASALVACVVLVLLLPLGACLWRWRIAGDGRRWLFGWAWIVLGLTPFAFQPVVPGDSRYWYFPSVGLAMALGFLARWLTPSRGWWRGLPISALGALVLWWTVLLGSAVGIYLRAGETAREIQRQVLQLPPSGDPIFIGNHPFFVRNAQQVPMAQVYHYGLSDAVHPPFGTRRAPIYPLLPAAGRELDAIHLGRPNAAVYLWDDARRQLCAHSFTADAALPQVEVKGPPDGETLGLSDLAATVVPVSGATGYRLLIVAEGNSTVATLQPDAARGVPPARFPREFVESMDRLYDGGEMFWWVEARDSNGGLLAASALRGFHLRR